MKTRQRIRRIPFIAPAPFGMEVMTLAQLRAMAAPGYLEAPQRPAFHLLILSTAGDTTHVVDFKRYRLAPGRTLWIRPGQVQRFADRHEAAAADLVLFQPDFLIPNTRVAAIANDRFGPVAFEHPSRALDALGRARRELRKEYAAASAIRPVAAAHTETLRHLLSVLILRMSLDAPGTNPEDPDDLYRQFRELLERDFAIAHDVAHYAHALRYSSRTLARATQAATGQTPKEAIQERLALEARRLLAHTNLPISTIAIQLGFRDPSNFSTFFAGQTEHTPSTFRDEQRATQQRVPSARVRPA